MNDFRITHLFWTMARWGLLAGLLAFAPAASAAIYVYVSEDGTRLISDHPVGESGYRLVSKTDDPFDSPNARARAVRGESGRAAADSSRFQSLIDEAAAEHQLNPALVKAIVHAESAFNPRALSPKGAMGLMQLMPDTARRYGASNAWDPNQNVRAGARYLRYLTDMFGEGNPLVIAAYNAGEAAVVKHHGIPPYRETKGYVRRVLQLFRQYARPV